MTLFNKGVCIGKAIAKRVRSFPVWEKEPTKKLKKKPTCWVLCPDFRAKVPKVVSEAASQKDYSFVVKIFSETREELLDALDHMIRCGYEEIEDGDKRFWLHAVNFSLQHQALFQARLKYIFRVRQIPEEIS